MESLTGPIPILLLAAGASSRMGQSKQLLPIKGKPLLQHMVEIASESKAGKVIVVLGANEKKHKETIQGYSIDVLNNHQWQKGMGSSIKLGLKFINERFPESEGVIISVCDQPHLSTAHFVRLCKTFSETEKSIVASSYKDTLGVPILFSRKRFSDLLSIEDTEGAKKIIQIHKNDVTSIPFPLGEIDLDTMEDYNTFNQ